MTRQINYSAIALLLILFSSCSSIRNSTGTSYTLITPDGSIFDKEIKVRMALSDEVGGDIRYTTDGSEPGPDSPVYKAPIVLNETCQLNASIYIDANKESRTSRAKFIKASPPSPPQRTILCVIDSTHHDMFDELPLENIRSLISRGVLYKNAVNLVSVPVKHLENYQWNLPTSYPPVSAGTVFLGTPDLNKHLIQQSFPGRAAFISNSTMFFPGKSNTNGRYITDSYAIAHDLQDTIPGDETEMKDDSVVREAERIIESDNPQFISIYMHAAAYAAQNDSKAGRDILNRESDWYKSMLNTDRCIGALTSWLDKKGYMKETVIIIAGCNGVNEKGLRSPTDISTTETSIIICGKNIKRKKEFQYAESIDLMPTICWLNGKDYSEFCQGKVLSEAFEGQAESIRSDHWLSRLNHVLLAYNELISKPSTQKILSRSGSDSKNKEKDKNKDKNKAEDKDKESVLSESMRGFLGMDKISSWQISCSSLAELACQNETILKEIRDSRSSYSDTPKEDKSKGKHHNKQK